MGFCWSVECGDGPCCAGHSRPGGAGWVGPTVLLCVYGFCSMMRPIEPFMTMFLTGPYKNLTTEQVMHQVYPVWTYSSLVLLVPVLLVTDCVRYKPVIILQGLSYVSAFLLILVGSGLRSAQLAFFSYSIAMAADVAYFSYIYSVVQPSRYQRVTSYIKGAVLLGYAAGAMLAQLLVSFGGVPLHYLAVVTLISVSFGLITSFFLPMPKRSLFVRTYYAQQEDLGANGHSSETCDSFIWRKSVSAAKYVWQTLPRFLLDCKECFSSVAVIFFCIWAATARCGFYQVASYVQVLWAFVEPVNFTAYNGGVDAVSTLSGAAATMAVGHVSLQWTVWADLVLGAFTVLMSACLFLMALTRDIWVNYVFFSLFKTVFMQLTTICTFQIAQTLTRERYALVFGINSLVGTVLQSVLTAAVISNKSVQLSISSQYVVYAACFAVISLVFTVRGLYAALHVNRSPAGEQAEPDEDTPEGPPL